LLGEADVEGELDLLSLGANEVEGIPVGASLGTDDGSFEGISLGSIEIELLFDGCSLGADDDEGLLEGASLGSEDG